MKELDILLTRYLDECYSGASAQEQEAFQRLLETQDPVIFDYCLGAAAAPEHLVRLIARIAANPPLTR